MIKKYFKRIKHTNFYDYLSIYKYRIFSIVSDKKFIEIKYKKAFGKYPDLKNPKTFNEKLNWLKLYDRKTIYSLLVDKCEAKKYVSNIIGKKHIVKTYGVWNKFNEIDFNVLPEKFVIKCTHDGGSTIVCKDKKTFNFKSAQKKINRHLKRNWYWHGREWPYKNVKPRIMIEELIESKTKVLTVYKFFCFNGQPTLVQVIENDKTNEETVDYYDINWNKINMRQNYANSNHILSKPECFGEMINIAKKLSFIREHIRIDMFESNGIVYFSEITFFSDDGFEKFYPEEWDLKLGEMMKGIPN